MRFYVVSVKKLTLLSYCSLGGYGFYWAYRNWQAYRAHGKTEINPAVRSLLMPIFLYSLMRKIDLEISSSRRVYDWSPLSLSIGFILVMASAVALWVLIPEWLTSNHPSLGRWGNAKANSDALLRTLALPVIVFSVGVYLLGVVQHAINFCEGDPEGKKINFRLSFNERAITLLGGVFWLMYLFVFFLSFLFWWAMRGF